MLTQRPEHLTEVMDETHVSAEDLRATLRFIRWVNRYLGGTRVMLRQLDTLTAGQTGPSLTIADIATGSGDIPAALLRWARRKSLPVRIVGLDIHSGTLGFAQRWTDSAQINYVQADALHVPLADNSVDFALCGLFLHHLREPQVLAVLREMLRISRRGIVVSDLLRERWALRSIRVLTLFSRKAVSHDSTVSVMKGWQRDEVEAWTRALGTPWLQYRQEPFSRFTLAGIRP